MRWKKFSRQKLVFKEFNSFYAGVLRNDVEVLCVEISLNENALTYIE